MFVDNQSACFYCDLDNGIPILPFTGDITDEELTKLNQFLSYLAYQDDFRKFIRNFLHLYLFKKTQGFGPMNPTRTKTWICESI